MADLSKNEKAEGNGLHSESSSDELDKVDKGDKIDNLLNDENDPDAGKSDEERAAIVMLSRADTGVRLIFAG